MRMTIREFLNLAEKHDWCARFPQPQAGDYIVYHNDYEVDSITRFVDPDDYGGYIIDYRDVHDPFLDGGSDTLEVLVLKEPEL